MNELRWLPTGLLLILLVGCEPSAPQINAPAAAFTLNLLDGGPVRFPDQYQGQVVAVHFWAQWCPYCLSEMTALEPIYRQHRERGLRLIAINVMEDPDTVRAFVQKLGLSFEVLLDPEGEVMRRYGAMGLPATFMIDRQGIIRRRIIGESTPEIFTAAVRDLL